MLLTIDQELCIQCNQCREICPMEAIHNLFGDVQIDTAHCVQCRLCLSVCPVDAIKRGMYS